MSYARNEKQISFYGKGTMHHCKKIMNFYTSVQISCIFKHTFYNISIIKNNENNDLPTKGAESLLLNVKKSIISSNLSCFFIPYSRILCKCMYIGAKIKKLHGCYIHVEVVL